MQFKVRQPVAVPKGLLVHSLLSERVRLTRSVQHRSQCSWLRFLCTNTLDGILASNRKAILFLCTLLMAHLRRQWFKRLSTSAVNYDGIILSSKTSTKRSGFFHSLDIRRCRGQFLQSQFHHCLLLNIAILLNWNSSILIVSHSFLEKKSHKMKNNLRSRCSPGIGVYSEM